MITRNLTVSCVDNETMIGLYLLHLLSLSTRVRPIFCLFYVNSKFSSRNKIVLNKWQYVLSCPLIKSFLTLKASIWSKYFNWFFEDLGSNCMSCQLWISSAQERIKFSWMGAKVAQPHLIAEYKAFCCVRNTTVCILQIQPLSKLSSEHILRVFSSVIRVNMSLICSPI